MDKNYVYVGMLVGFETYDCIVLEKQQHTCSLLHIKTRERINDVLYSELDEIYNRSDVTRFYNRKMRMLGSAQKGKFDVNSDKEFTFQNGSKVWFTSDTHFSHDNIMKFCQRPFKDTNDMNEQLVKKWNEMIAPDDTVFHLGDFAWGGSDNWCNVLNKLNGHIHLIIGNHDVKNLRSNYLQFFESISFQKQITVEGRKIYLNHYPLLTWGGIYRKPDDRVWQLFGHVHSNNGKGGADSGRLHYLLPWQYDVGVDNNNYRPINFTEIKEIIAKNENDINLNNIDVGQSDNVDRIVYGHIELKNQLLMSMLTSEQLAKFYELTTDKGE